MPQAAEGCARAGIGWIGVWRDRLAEVGTTSGARAIRDAGLRVSGLCRGGWFGAADAVTRRANMDDNRLAVDQAAELGALVLVLVCGPAPNRNLVAARDYVADCVVELCEYGAERGVKIGIEPLHPMYCGDRSVVVTLDQALAMTQGLAPARAGVVVDTYHVWWDPSVVEKIRACGPKIAGFHLADWLVPTPDMLNGRGMLGDGVVDMRSLREAVDGAGYDGPIEVELFNPDIWAIPGDDCLRLIKERYSAHVLSGAQP